MRLEVVVADVQGHFTASLSVQLVDIDDDVGRDPPRAITDDHQVAHGDVIAIPACGLYDTSCM